MSWLRHCLSWLPLHTWWAGWAGTTRHSLDSLHPLVSWGAETRQARLPSLPRQAGLAVVSWRAAFAFHAKRSRVALSAGVPRSPAHTRATLEPSRPRRPGETRVALVSLQPRQAQCISRVPFDSWGPLGA